MPQVFINYRREDEPYVVDNLGRSLTRRFGQAEVFYDRASIQPGDNFRAALSRAAGATTALLVVVGPNWLSLLDEKVHSAEEDDWVRQEIRLAKQHGARIIPILSRRNMGPLSASELPEELGFLAELQHVEFDPADTERCLDDIAAELEDLVPGLRREGVTSRGRARAALVGVEDGDDGVVLTFQRGVKDVAATPEEHFRWLKQRFVSPQGLAAVREKLRTNRGVLVVGKPGSGRRSTAKMLLSELSQDRRSFVEFVDPSFDAKSSLRGERLQYGVPHLLDLTHSPEEVVLKRQRELPGLLGALDERDAYLVVILPCSQGERLGQELAYYQVCLCRPDLFDVLRSHLEFEGVFLPQPFQGPPELQEVLQGPVRHVAALAGRVVACSKDHPEWTVDQWLGAGLKAAGDDQREVAEQLGHEGLISARNRGVLLAAALCAGASRDAVFFAAQELFAVLADLRGEQTRLEQDGYRKQLEDIEVHEDNNTQQLTFSRYGYAGAVRKHFWDNYPDLRAAFKTWVDRLTELDRLTRADCQELVDRYVEQSLRTGHVADVRELVEQWLDSEGKKNRTRRMELATQALMAGVVDDRGTPLRELLYKWSTTDALATRKAQILVQVCTSALADAFPDQALVRLHQRARREGSGVTPSAAEALRALGEKDENVLRSLIHRLAEGKERYEHPDLTLFRTMIDPAALAREQGAHSLVSEPGVRQSLVRLWASLLKELGNGRDGDRDGSGEIRRTLQDWLSAAGQLDEPEILLSIPLDAAESGGVETLARVYVVARDWVRASGGDPRVGDRVSTLVDRAQGIDPADYSVHPAAEEMVP